MKSFILSKWSQFFFLEYTISHFNIFKVLLFFVYYVWDMHVIMWMWRPEDNLQEFSPSTVDFRDGTVSHLKKIVLK